MESYIIRLTHPVNLVLMATALLSTHSRSGKIRTPSASATSSLPEQTEWDTANKLTVVAADGPRQEDERPYCIEAVRLPEAQIYFSAIKLSSELVRINQSPRSIPQATMPDQVARIHAAG